MSLLTLNPVANRAWFAVKKPIRDFWVKQYISTTRERQSWKRSHWQQFHFVELKSGESENTQQSIDPGKDILWLPDL